MYRPDLRPCLKLKNLELAGCYHQEPMSYPALLTWCEEQAELFGSYIADTGEFLEQALSEGKKVVLEAQLGAMRDIDYGIFPYTSSSSTFCLWPDRCRNSGKIPGSCGGRFKSIFYLCWCRSFCSRKGNVRCLGRRAYEKRAVNMVLPQAVPAGWDRLMP